MNLEVFVKSSVLSSGFASPPPCPFNGHQPHKTDCHLRCTTFFPNTTMTLATTWMYMSNVAMHCATPSSRSEPVDNAASNEWFQHLAGGEMSSPAKRTETPKRRRTSSCLLPFSHCIVKGLIVPMSPKALPTASGGKWSLMHRLMEYPTDFWKYVDQWCTLSPSEGANGYFLHHFPLQLPMDDVGSPYLHCLH